MMSSIASTFRANVAVVGAGPAGLAAASRIAESGRTVVVLDASPQAGGQIWRHGPGAPAPAVARRWMTRVERAGATVVNGASVTDVRNAEGGAPFRLTAERGGNPCRVDADAIVLATGARERFLPFPGWTLPGVVGIGGAQALLKSGCSFAGKRVVIAGSGPLLLPVAAALVSHGAKVILVAEQAPRNDVVRFALGLWRRPAALLQAARYRAGFLRVPYALGMWVTAARGVDRLEEVTLTDGRVERTIACDVLCAAHGLVPNTELARLIGCAVVDGAVVVNEQQETSIPGVFAAGEAVGVGGVDLATVEGEIAGLCAAGDERAARRLRSRRVALRAVAERMERAFAPRAELRAVVTPETIVCRCEDVQAGAIMPTWGMRQAKLYTRAGMGPCQGRVCGASLQFLFGWTHDAVRVPSEPALVATILAGAASDAAPVQSGA